MTDLRPSSLAAGLLLLASPVSAQRRVEGHQLFSDSLPRIVMQLDSSMRYLGSQSFTLYNVAHAEQHFFAELDGTRIKRYVWIQFEGYLTGNNNTYDYSSDPTIDLWGQSIHRVSTLRQIPTSEQRPDSDGARARRYLRERGYTLGPDVLYHRLVWLLDKPARNELMVIYMEDVRDHGVEAASLAPGGTNGEQLPRLLEESLTRAGRSIQIRSR